VHLSASSLAGKKGPDVHVTRKWVDENGYSNVQVSCFGCDRWSGTTLNVMSANQSWIWAWNGKQMAGSASGKMGLQKHEHKGLFGFLIPPLYLQPYLPCSTIWILCIGLTR
jgi:hypothetical protein